MKFSNRSIASRIFKIVFLGNLLIFLTIFMFSEWILDELESINIKIDQEIEVDYFEKYGNKQQPFKTQSSQLIKIYKPAGDDDQLSPKDLPIVFKGISPPFYGEIEHNDKEYNVIVHQFPEGVLYIAKDVHIFEEQEEIIEYTIISFLVILSILSWFLAVFASRKISRPIVDFVKLLELINVEGSDVKLTCNFSDTELNQIAESINNLLSRNQEILYREKTLISMASHELRTPIAVIIGATNVIESRNQLGSKDKITLNRISAAANEMKSNVSALMRLVRKTKSIESQKDIYISRLIQGLIDNYAIENIAYSNRLIVCLECPDLHVKADEALVRMLIHNLVSNALNHTTGKVCITLQNNYLDIEDEGGDESDEKSSMSVFEPTVTGLGLYIVGLACEALNWHYEFLPSAQGYQTRIRLWFEKASNQKS